MSGSSPFISTLQPSFHWDELVSSHNSRFPFGDNLFVFFSALCNLGSAYKERHDLLKATELWRECLSIFEKILSATHPRLISGIAHFMQHGVMD